MPVVSFQCEGLSHWMSQCDDYSICLSIRVIPLSLIEAFLILITEFSSGFITDIIQLKVPIVYGSFSLIVPGDFCLSLMGTLLGTLGLITPYGRCQLLSFQRFQRFAEKSLSNSSPWSSTTDDCNFLKKERLQFSLCAKKSWIAFFSTPDFSTLFNWSGGLKLWYNSTSIPLLSQWKRHSRTSYSLKAPKE